MQNAKKSIFKDSDHYPLTSGWGMSEASQSMIENMTFTKLLEKWKNEELLDSEDMAILLELSEKLDKPLPYRLLKTIQRLYKYSLPNKTTGLYKWILLLTLIATIGGWFYWFQWRPGKIKTSCAYESRNREDGHLILADQYQACLHRNGI